MSYAKNTVEAFIKAGNYNGARKIAEELLNKNSEDVDAWEILIEIELKKRNYVKSLDLATQTLQFHPFSPTVRQAEILSLMYLKNCDSARVKLKKFKQDFPTHIAAYDMMDICISIQSKKAKKAISNLKKSRFSSDKRTLAIMEYKSGNFLVAQKLLKDALQNTPNDAHLNAIHARNQLYLGKIFSARQAARRAIELNPQVGFMRFLLIMSWCLLYPPLYYLHLLCTVFYVLSRHITDWGAIIVMCLLSFALIKPVTWFHGIMGNFIAMPQDFSFLSWLFMASYAAIFCIARVVESGHKAPTPKAVRLKQY